MIARVDEYTVFRKDRPTRGNGVIIVCKKLANIKFSKVRIPQKFDNIEVLSIDVFCNKHICTRIVNFHYPPHLHCSFSSNGYALLFTECIADLHECSQPCLILGDLNMPNINWRNYRPNCRSADYGVDTDFLDYCKMKDYRSSFQLANFPTRDKKVLDITLADDPNSVSVLRPSNSLGNSDHITVLFEFTLQSDSSSLIDNCNISACA